MQQQQPVTTSRSPPAPTDLEQQQSWWRQVYRRSTDGKDADLTELATPATSDIVQERQKSYEKEVQRARTNDAVHGEGDNDQVLSELVAPAREITFGDQRLNADESELEKQVTQSTHSTVKPSKSEQRLTDLFVISWLIFFSFLGTLARLGVEALTTYPNTPFPSTVVWANMGGCFFMGFLIQDRQLFRSPGKNKSDDDHAKYKKGLPLYIGLTTGFCGSFTSFSSFITDAFLALTNDLPNADDTLAFRMSDAPIQNRNGGYSFMAVLAILIIQPAVSFAAFNVGRHVAQVSQAFWPTMPSHKFKKLLDPIAVFMAFGCWIGTMFLAVFPPSNDWRPRAVFPLLFAPLGTLLRFYFSKYLNSRIPWFPLGTFAANIIGVCIEGACYDLKYTVTVVSSTGRGNMVSCGVLAGIMEGFCGCATTVSTWIAELNTLEIKHRYFYGLSTIAIAISLQTIIMGSVGWTVGFGQATCDI